MARKIGFGFGLNRRGRRPGVSGPTAPGMFTAGQWSVVDTGTGGQATISITALPVTGGSAITALQVSVGGGAWAALSGTTTGSYIVSGFTNGNATSVNIRAINAIGVGATSDTKSVTTSAAATVPGAFTAGQWTIADAGTGGQATVNIISLPATGGSAITALQYRIGAGAWTAFTGTGTGARTIGGFTNGAATNVLVRAVNAVGVGPDSDTKSVTTSAGATVPAAFTAGQWGVVSAGSGQATINILALPSNGGSAITDLEFKIGAGAWTSLGVATTGSFTRSGFTDNVSTAVLVRARNSIGVGADSDSKSVTTGFAARFGTSNGIGTGAFDTNLYPAAVPANGTYGPFSVALGIITPNAALSAGSYSVGSWTVTVSADEHAVATQAEFDAVGVALSGKTVIVREGAALTLGTTWNNDVNLGDLRILGDGTADPLADVYTTALDARRHFVNVNGRNLRQLIFDNLRIVTNSTAGAKQDGMNIASSGAGNFCIDVQVRRTSVIVSRPDPVGDYSGGLSTFPGGKGISFTGDCRRIMVHDVFVMGSSEFAVDLGSVTGFGEIIGPWIDLSYGDGIRVPNAPHVAGGFLWTRPLAISTDAGNPHSDGLQSLGANPFGIIEASALYDGDARGKTRSQGFFLANGLNGGTMRDLAAIEGAFFPFSMGEVSNTVMERLAWVPPSDTSLPTSNKGGIRYGNVSRTGTNILRDSTYGSATLGSGITPTNVLVNLGYNAAQMGAAFPGWTWPVASIPTLADVFNTIVKPAPGGAADGRAPNVTLAAGALRSTYVLPDVAAPVLSALAVTPTVNGCTGTIRTTEAIEPIWWVAVSAGSPVPTARQIKLQRAVGALTYGSITVDRTQTGVDLPFTVTGIPAASDAVIYLVQNNGWSRTSTVASAAFSVPAPTGVAYKSVGAVSGQNSGGTLNIAMPTHVAGDLLVMVVGYDAGNLPTDPAGWGSPVHVIVGQSATYTFRIYAKVAGPSEPASVPVTVVSTRRHVGVCFAVERQNVAPIGNVSTKTVFSATSFTNNAITAVANSLVFHIFGWNTGGTLGNLTSVPAGLTEIVNVRNPGTVTQRGIWIGYEGPVTAGTTAGRTAVIDTANSWLAGQVEIRTE